MREFTFTVGHVPEKIRIDVYLTAQMTGTTRSGIQKRIAEGQVHVHGKPVKSNYIVMEGDVIQVFLPEAVPLEIQEESMDLDILYEDLDLIVINKPQEMVVHPAPGHYQNTLVNGLLAHCKEELSGINGVLRPGIVHRIDKDTSGILVVAKNDIAHQCLSEQLQNHTMHRIYYAIVFGVIKEESGTIDAPIGRNEKDRKKMAINYKNGKRAVTHFKVLQRFRGYTLIQAQLETGRTHQIRVHMSSIGFPLLGDMVYGRKKQPFALKGQVLHAKCLGFVHPTTKEYMEFEVALPEYFSTLIHSVLCKT